jgi:hypothetical protein
MTGLWKLAEKLHMSAPLAKGLWDVINGRFLHPTTLDK